MKKRKKDKDAKASRQAHRERQSRHSEKAGQKRKIQRDWMEPPRDTMKGLLNHTLGLSESNRIMSDEVFKTLFQYKYVAAKMLHTISEDFAIYSLDDLVKGICDLNVQRYAGDRELFTSKIDIMNLEDKSIGEKEIRYDLVFQLSLPDKTGTGKTDDILVNFTIDLEMQQERPSYSLPARGIYYAAALLRNTLQPGKDYSHIHKVYSVWFCGSNCIEGDLADQHYRHSYRILRTYNRSCGKEGCSYQSPKIKGESLIKEVVLDQEADLIEVIFIELPKQDQLMQFEVAELGQALNGIFRHPKEILAELEERFGSLDYLEIEKEVREVVSMEKFKEIVREEEREQGRKEGRQEGRKEGRQEGRQEGIVESICNCYESLLASGKNEKEAIEMTASLLRQQGSDVRKIIGEQMAV